MIDNIQEYFSQEKWKETSVLELGTGEGEITKVLAELFKNVFTVTSDFEALDRGFEALQEYGNIHVCPFELYAGDDRLPIPRDNTTVAILNSADTYEKTVSDMNRLIADSNKEIRYVVVPNAGIEGVDRAVTETINNVSGTEKISHPDLTILWLDRLISV